MKLTTDIRTPERLGQILIQGRQLRGLSQRELARQLGVGQKWVWEMEQGKPGLLMARLFKMLEKTGVRLYAEIDTGTDNTGGAVSASTAAARTDNSDG